jgi:cysteine protease ATG4
MDSEPVVMLGQLYNSHALLYSSTTMSFKVTFARVPWITYKSNFRPIYRIDAASNTLTEITSDVGWGCTVRVGQMMMLSAIQRALGAQRWPNFNLLKLIQEYWPEAPYSLHKITEVAYKLDSKPGDWFSPSSVCFALEVRLT